MRRLAILGLAACIALSGTLGAAGCGGPEGVTVGEFHQMSAKEQTALLKCQLDKYADKHSQKKADKYLREYVEGFSKAKDAADVTPLQEQLIEEEGISCTTDEMARYKSEHREKTT